MYTRAKTKQSFGLRMIRILPAFFYLLIAVAAGFGYFRGESLRYALPVFLLVTRVNMVIYAKYKLDRWGIYAIYAFIALMVIFFQL
ncbi:MAG: hypothetical protein K2Q21_15990 [Chitinophagaceae bacterium]|nr:hypothetical protein [Chitinophagaceae bacterium]